jgi:hypothetical protein
MARSDTPNPQIMKPPAEEIGLIQGATPDSINEWFVYLALERLRAAYIYQYAIGGGTSLRGGQVIDFLVFSATGPIPVFVQGAYWHTYRQDPEQVLKIAEARRVFRNEPVLLEEEETNTREEAYRAVRTKIWT